MKRFLLAVLSILAACHGKPAAEPAQAPPGEAWLSDKQVKEGKIVVEPAAAR